MTLGDRRRPTHTLGTEQGRPASTPTIRHHAATGGSSANMEGGRGTDKGAHFPRR